MPRAKTAPGPRTGAPRPIFLAGPPGAGKTTLGSRVCQGLGLRFFDPPEGATLTDVDEALRCAPADVVALPWPLQQQRATFAWCRRTGHTVGLWAHPLEMQARSALPHLTFTPRAGLTAQGGFGRRGTGCLEHRKLARACDEVLMLDGAALDEAADLLRELVEDLRQPEPEAPAEREGLTEWAETWAHDYDADPRACRILVDAMARYTLHLKEQGASPRKMSGVYSDLDAAGLLVMMYEAPRGKTVLEHFGRAPHLYEFGSKFSDAPRAVARYEATLGGFSAFLREAGLLPRT
jgi:hypothetical protein